MWSDGLTEVYSFTSSDRSLSLGGVVDGARWGRAGDAAGLAFASSWISSSHGDYLARGGIDAFVGDGALTRGSERVIEAFYRWRLLERTWLSADAQRIDNPAYNRDRGPAHFFASRLHADF